jgi:hypothetical protein
MRRNPSGWRIEDLITVAEANGIDWRRPGRGGSHVIFGAKGVREIVSVPDKRPIKPPYVAKFIDLIDAFRELSLPESGTNGRAKAAVARKADDHDPKSLKKRS